MILFCYDGSESAKRALKVAHQTLREDGITLLYVWNPPDETILTASRATGIATATTPLEVTRQAMVIQHAHDVIDDGETLAGELGLDVDVRDARNDSTVWQTILDVADELDAQLIVAGTHGTTAVQEGMLGSVSSGLVHHARRPVLIVPVGRT